MPRIKRIVLAKPVVIDLYDFFIIMAYVLDTGIHLIK